MVAGYLAARGDAGSLPRADLGPIWLTVLVLGAILSLFLVITVHELGHLLGGRLARFRFLLLVVGPLKVTRGPDGLAFALNRSLPLAGGLAASGPTPDDLENLPRRSALMVAGGPMASFVLGGTGLTAYRALAEAPALETAQGLVVLTWLLMLTGVASAAIGVITLIPGKTGGFMTDGARLLQVLRGGPAAEAEIAVQTLVAWSTGGVPPAAWLPDVIERALEAPPGPFQVVAHHFAWRHAIHTGDLDGERHHRAELLERLDQAPDPVRAGLLLDMATQCAISGEAEDARTLYDRVNLRGAILDPHADPLARAALAAAEGRVDEARTCVAEAERLLVRAMDPGTMELDRGRLARIRSVLTAGPG